MKSFKLIYKTWKISVRSNEWRPLWGLRFSGFILLINFNLTGLNKVSTLFLFSQDPKKKTNLETRLDVLVQELVEKYRHTHTHMSEIKLIDQTRTGGWTESVCLFLCWRIGETHGLRYIRLILSGKTLSPGEFPQTLWMNQMFVD